ERGLDALIVEARRPTAEGRHAEARGEQAAVPRAGADDVPVVLIREAVARPRWRGAERVARVPDQLVVRVVHERRARQEFPASARLEAMIEVVEGVEARVLEERRAQIVSDEAPLEEATPRAPREPCPSAERMAIEVARQGAEVRGLDGAPVGHAGVHAPGTLRQQDQVRPGASREAPLSILHGGVA